MPSTLAALPLFSELHPSDLDRLVALMSAQGFRRSERVISSADGRTHVFVLTQGRLRVCSVTSGGREVTLHRFCSGSVLGLANLVSGATVVLLVTLIALFLISAVPGSPLAH